MLRTVARKISSFAKKDADKENTKQHAHKEKTTNKMAEKETAQTLEAKLKESAAVKAPVKPQSEPRFALERNNRDWAIENYGKTEKPLKVEEPKMNQNVYIRNCKGTHIHVLKKVNNVVIERCRDVVLVVDSVIAIIEIIRAEGCQLQILGRAHAVSLDNCSGINLFASLASRELQVTSSQISDVNLHVPESEQTPDEWVELPIPAQYVHQLKPGTTDLTTKVSDLYR